MNTTYKYALLINMDRRRSYDAYDPDTLFCRTWVGTVDAPTMQDAGDILFVRHNRDDRPDGQSGPSLSVGDVIVYDDAVAYRVEEVGFQRLPTLPHLVDTGRWLDVFDRVNA